MNIDWLQVLTTILLVVAGYLVEYFKTKSALIQKAQQAINHAEKEYESVAKSGGQKMQAAVRFCIQYVPSILRPIVNEQFVEKLIQSVFDYMANYASKQLDKVVDKI